MCVAASKGVWKWVKSIQRLNDVRCVSAEIAVALGLPAPPLARAPPKIHQPENLFVFPLFTAFGDTGVDYFLAHYTYHLNTSMTLINLVNRSTSYTDEPG